MILLPKAYHLAAVWHAKQKRKGEAAEPYINHLVEVAVLVSGATAGQDQNLIAAAVLHDAIEDAGVAYETLVHEFNEDVANLVREVTDDKSLEKDLRKHLQIESTPTKSERAKIIKLADKVSNLRSILISPPPWTLERKWEYLAWARLVVAGAKGVSSSLDGTFETVAAELEQALENERQVQRSEPVTRDDQPRKWIVYVDDNFNFMDEDERVTHGTFGSYDQAVLACKAIVNACLPDNSTKSAAELIEDYKSFGDDPFIVGPAVEPKFSAWDYAEQRCRQIAGDQTKK